MADEMFDLVIRGGEVHDGEGGPAFRADVAVQDGLIARVGEVEGRGTEEIDATGKVVTPGFVDIHTHYDGQAIWDDQVAPSSWHGVTTAVMGNCGVGFAPCRPGDRTGLIELMEGVEDIPGPVLHAGLTWEWETFPEYLDALDRLPRDIDLCALVPHAPLRVFVMGDRALKLQPANADDVAHMRTLVKEAIDAGAFGVSSSRSTAHTSINGDYTPTLLAREREISGLMQGMADAGRGLFEVTTESLDPDVIGEYHMIRRTLERSGRRCVYSLAQSGQDTTAWRELMAYSDQAWEDGVYLRPVSAPRAIGLILGLEASQNPFIGTASYHAIKDKPLTERVAIMKDSDFRRRLLSDDRLEHSTWPLLGRLTYEKMFPMGSPPNYTPTADDSVAALAAAAGVAPDEYVYDVMLENDGMGFLYVPFTNYASGDLSACGEMLANPNVIMGLGDGGAHVGYILDAGFPTWLLTYWVREQKAMSLAEGIRRLTSDTADVMELEDRGRIREGLRADLNVIDFDRLGFTDPYVAYDLPEGGKRMLQKTTGYVATIVAGQVTYRDGVDTGARPGKLVRSGAVRAAGMGAGAVA